ncbi:MAG TPA: flagellar hook-basal body complex protein FliE [Spirochaetota bacterium]|mgnify:CR=1 FL=1|nr:flagellar hook-basal body complex protein FliE [Spirochaetota bacterium]
MNVLSVNEVKGDFVDLRVTDKNHIGGSESISKSGEKVASAFSEMFNNAFNEVNDLELKSINLTNQMAIDPESVNIHDVQIAAEEAEMAVMFTKGIVDRVIRAYKEITSLR